MILEDVCAFRYQAVVSNDKLVSIDGIKLQIPRPHGGRSFAKASVHVRQRIEGVWRVFYKGNCIAEFYSMSVIAIAGERTNHCEFEYVRITIACECCDLNRSCDFEHLTAGDAENPSLVRRTGSTCSLGGIETDAFRCAQCLVTQLWIFDRCITHANEKLQGNVVCNQAMVGKKSV
jgi:hypothetical protein